MVVSTKLTKRAMFNMNMDIPKDMVITECHVKHIYLEFDDMLEVTGLCNVTYSGEYHTPQKDCI